MTSLWYYQPIFHHHRLIDIALGISNRLDIQWGLFIAISLALFGSIIYIDRPLRHVEKTTAILPISIIK